MDQQLKIKIILFVIFLVATVLISFCTKEAVDKSYERGYVNACQDFYQGTLKYDLFKDEKGNKIWIKNKKVNNE